jgi:hypothetical protein
MGQVKETNRGTQATGSGPTKPLLAAIETERLIRIRPEEQLKEVHEVAAYRTVMEKLLTPERVEAQTALLRHHRRCFRASLADHDGGLLCGYDTVDAIRSIERDDPEMASQAPEARGLMWKLRTLPPGPTTVHSSIR